MKATMEDVRAYFRRYDKRSFAVAACQGNEPPEAEIVAFEGHAGFALPGEFREFTMSPLGGLYMEVREELWPRPKAYDVGPFWSFLYGLMVFGIATGIPAWLDLRAQLDKFRTGTKARAVPFMARVGDANPYCFLPDRTIAIWDHETDELQPVDADFPTVVMREIRELEERLARKLRGEDRQ